MKKKISVIILYFIGLCNFFIPANASDNLKFITATVPNKLDSYVPWELRSLPDLNFASLIFEPLFRTNSSGELEPIIAKSWEASGQDLRVTLREERVFSDGTEIVADFIIESFKQLCLKSALAKNVLSNLRGCASGKPDIVALGSKEVAFRINGNPRSFLQSLAHLQAIIFKYDPKLKPFTLLGSGPYQLSEFSSYHAKLATNLKSAKTYAQKNAGLNLEYVDIADLSKYLLSHQPDAILMNLSTFMKDIKPINYKRIDHSPFVTEVLSINRSLEPFASNPQLFLSLKAYLYNNSRIHECFPNEARQAYGFVPIGLGGSIAESAPKIISSFMVKDALEIANSKEMKNSIIVIHQHSGRKQPCVMAKVHDAFAAVGLQARFEHLTDYPRLFKIYQNQKTQATVELSAFVQRDIGQSLEKFSPTSSFPMYFYQSESAAKELEKARRSFSVNERFPYYRNIVREIEEKSGVVPLYYLSDTNLYKDCVTGHEEQGLFNPNTYLQIPRMSSGGCK